jgi:hypothetical protein
LIERLVEDLRRSILRPAGGAGQTDLGLQLESLIHVPPGRISLPDEQIAQKRWILDSALDGALLVVQALFDVGFLGQSRINQNAAQERIFALPAGFRQEARLLIFQETEDGRFGHEPLLGQDDAQAAGFLAAALQAPKLLVEGLLELRGRNVAAPDGDLTQAQVNARFKLGGNTRHRRYSYPGA